MKKKNIVKIVIVFVLMILVANIFVVKNNNKNSISEIAYKNKKDYDNDIEALDFSMEIKDGELDLDRLTSYGVPVLIDFGADYCQPCREFQPILREIKETYGDNIIIKFIDIQEYPELAEEYATFSIPLQLLFSSDGKPYAPPSNLMLNMHFQKDDNDEILLTCHIGAMSKNKTLLILNDMGLKGQYEIEE